MVEATIELEALEEHQFVIKPDFDDNLKQYRKRMDDLRDEMVAEHIRVGNDLKQDTEKKLKLEQQHVYGWCLRLTRNVRSPEDLYLMVGSWFYSWEEGIYCRLSKFLVLIAGIVDSKGWRIFYNYGTSQ